MSVTHIPTYAGLLSINVILLYVLRLNHCQIFFVTYNLALMSILNSLISFKSILFLEFSIVLPETAFFITLYNAFSSVSIFHLLAIILSKNRGVPPKVIYVFWKIFKHSKLVQLHFLASECSRFIESSH